MRRDAHGNQRDTFRRDTGVRQEIPRCRGRSDDGVDGFQQVDLMSGLGGRPGRAEAVLRLHDDWASCRRRIRDAQGECGPCRVVHPVLEEIDAERDDLKIVSINVDENQQTAANYEVLSIPTMILFKDGAIAKKVVGAMPKRRLEAELEPALA